MLPLLPFERLSKEAGIKRISGDALEELRDAVEERGISLATHAVRLAHHANRRTVSAHDISFAVRKRF